MSSEAHATSFRQIREIRMGLLGLAVWGLVVWAGKSASDSHGSGGHRETPTNVYADPATSKQRAEAHGAEAGAAQGEEHTEIEPPYFGSNQVCINNTEGLLQCEYVHEHVHIHVLTWRLDFVKEPLAITGFIILLCIIKIVFEHFHHVSEFIPESCALIFIGLIIGAFFYVYRLYSEDYEFHSFLQFNGDSFFLYLLPPIILEAAYSLRDRSFLENLGTILLYAVVGTILNMALIGGILYAIVTAGIMGDYAMNVTLFDCLIFSSLIAAVDPVAVLAIFQELGVNQMLYFMVFGESLLNDAVTVVLYNLMVQFKEKEINSAEASMTAEDVFLGIAAFLCVSLGACLIGFVCGLLTALMTKYTGKVRVAEPTVMFGMAYLSYLLAELVHWSGIIAIICCGLVQSHYAAENIASKSYITVHYFAKVMAGVSESIIFIILGVMLVNDYHIWDCWSTGFALVSLILVTLIRFIITFSLTFVVNQYTDGIRKISRQEQMIMSYGGLRGAISFSLAYMLDPCVVPAKNTLLTATFLVILFTVFFQGITIKPLVRILRIKLHSKDSSMVAEVSRGVVENMMQGIDLITGHKGSHYYSGLAKHLSHRFLRPHLQANSNRKGKGLVAAAHAVSMADGLTTGRQMSSQSHTEGAALFDSLHSVDGTGLPNSVSTSMLDHQDEQREMHSGKGAGGRSQFRFERPEDLLMLRDVLMTPPHKTMHYADTDKHIHTSEEDASKYLHMAMIRRRFGQHVGKGKKKKGQAGLSMIGSAMLPLAAGMSITSVNSNSTATTDASDRKPDGVVLDLKL